MGGPTGDGPPGEGSTVGAANVRPFVGRARELLELESALETARSGHGSLVLISGEPGIGKSRLIEALADSARDRGCSVLLGRCWDGGGAPAYWPWVQVVRAAGADLEELVAAAERGQPGRPSVSDVVDPAAARFRLFDRVGRFLSERSTSAPVLVVLDDLHAADEPSMLLLRFLATSVADHRMLLVGSYREAEPRIREEAELFGELSRLGRRVPLAGLSRSEIARFIEIVRGAPAPDAWVRRVHELTAGNPFFVREVVRTWSEQESGRDHLAPPEEVRALIRRRVSGLSREASATLHVAAVIGREFDLRVLTETTTLSTERLIDVLEEAQAAGIISLDRGPPRSYAFAHDLLREAMYEDLPHTRRMELHRAIGQVLEQAFSADVDPHLAALAHHYAQSAPLGDAGIAAEYAVRAGDRAARLLAYEDAARLYEGAVELEESGERSPQRRGEILLRLGDAHARSADSEAAQARFEEAAEIARRIDDPEMLAQAAFGYVTASEPVRLGFGGILLTAIFEEGSRGVALLEDALTRLSPADSTIRARALARLATALYPTQEEQPRLRLAAEALDMALRLGDPAALVEALHAKHWATLSPDLVDERLANAEQTLLVATGAGEDEAAFLARHARLHCFLELGDAAGVDRELGAMEQLTARIRQPFYAWHVACMRALRTLLHGNATEAEFRVRAAYETGRMRASEYVTYMFEHAQLLCIRWTEGRLDEVADTIHEHSERYRRTVAPWRDALLAAEIGDEVAARAELARHSRNGFREVPRDGLWLLHLSALAQACVLVRDRERAQPLFDLLRPFAARNAISISTMPFGPVAMRLGMLAALLERWDDVDPLFATAMEVCAGLGAPALRARVLLEHAKVLLMRGWEGDRDRAVDLLSEAAAICEDLDLTGIGARVTVALDEVKPARMISPPEAVFRREGQFWTVAFEGRTARLHDLRGLRYIADLLASPGREFHALDLLTAHRSAATREAGVHELEGVSSAVSEPILDARAKEEYRRRLRDLAEELEEARSWHDAARVSKLEAEVDAISDELRRSVGLGGRDRQMLSPAERARVSVTKAIKAAIRAVEQECPAMGAHLEAAIRTGRFCSYAPPGQAPPRWVL
jgi:hypothetical protein